MKEKHNDPHFKKAAEAVVHNMRTPADFLKFITVCLYIPYKNITFKTIVYAYLKYDSGSSTFLLFSFLLDYSNGKLNLSDLSQESINLIKNSDNEILTSTYCYVKGLSLSKQNDVEAIYFLEKNAKFVIANTGNDGLSINPEYSRIFRYYTRATFLQTTHHLGNWYWELKNYEKAFYYFKAGVEIAGTFDFDSTKDWIQILSRSAVVMALLNINYKEACSINKIYQPVLEKETLERINKHCR